MLYGVYQRQTSKLIYHYKETAVNYLLYISGYEKVSKILEEIPHIITLQDWRDYVSNKDRPKKKIKIKDKEIPKTKPWKQQTKAQLMGQNGVAMYQNQMQYYPQYYPMTHTQQMYYGNGYYFGSY